MLKYFKSSFLCYLKISHHKDEKGAEKGSEKDSSETEGGNPSIGTTPATDQTNISNTLVLKEDQAFNLKPSRKANFSVL